MKNQCGVKLEDASSGKKSASKANVQNVKKEIEEPQESSELDALERIRRFSKFCRGGIKKCQKEEDFQEDQALEE